MIVYSDDNDASYLWGTYGGPAIVTWAAGQYGISVTPPPASMPGWWGLVGITARAMTTFYARIANDPAVGPWLMSAMANAAPYGSDGFWQHFGIPSATSGWRVKQGWMSYSGDRLHSTGFVGGDRYTVALLTQGSGGYYYNGSGTVTLMARALMPGGTIPQPPPPAPTPTADPRLPRRHPHRRLHPHRLRHRRPRRLQRPSSPALPQVPAASGKLTVQQPVSSVHSGLEPGAVPPFVFAVDGPRALRRNGAPSMHHGRHASQSAHRRALAMSSQAIR